MATKWDRDINYEQLIQDAVAQGDYMKAAQAEQSRNEKIKALNAEGGGTNPYGAVETNRYGNWLDYGGSANNVGVFNNNQEAIRKQMNDNSIAWHGADDATKDSLHAENQQLAAQLGGSVGFDANTGLWSGQAAPVVNASTPAFNYDVQQPTFQSNYSTRIDAMLDKILNREAFSYDAATDPLFQQYQKQYNREGNRSMNDTLAAAASNAGGMNSYAITAAQQANDYYASQLTDKIPELYQLAYEMYLQDVDNQVRDLGLLQQMDDMQYARYRDTMSDWRNDRDFAYGQFRDDVGDNRWQTEFNYGVGRDALADSRYDTEWQYQLGRDKINDNRYDTEWQYQIGRDKVEDKRYDTEWDYKVEQDRLDREYQAKRDSISDSRYNAGKSSGGGYYGSDNDSGSSIAQTLQGISDPNEAQAYLLGLGLNGWEYDEYASLWQNMHDADGDGEANSIRDQLMANGNETIEMDTDSILALGLGPISEDRLAELVADGEIYYRLENGKIKFYRGSDPSAKFGFQPLM